MVSKDRFSNFLAETMRKPYFSALYDIDMWNEDKRAIENDLRVLDILKKHLNIQEVKDSDDDYVYEVVDIYIMSKEETQIIKDWLINNGK